MVRYPAQPRNPPLPPNRADRLWWPASIPFSGYRGHFPHQRQSGHSGQLHKRLGLRISEATPPLPNCTRALRLQFLHQYGTLWIISRPFKCPPLAYTQLSFDRLQCFFRPHMLTDYNEWPGLTLQQNQTQFSSVCKDLCWFSYYCYNCRYHVKVSLPIRWRLHLGKLMYRPFMELEGRLTHSQHSTTGSYPKPDKTNPSQLQFFRKLSQLHRPVSHGADHPPVDCNVQFCATPTQRKWSGIQYDNCDYWRWVEIIGNSHQRSHCCTHMYRKPLLSRSNPITTRKPAAEEIPLTPTIQPSCIFFHTPSPTILQHPPWN